MLKYRECIFDYTLVIYSDHIVEFQALNKKSVRSAQ